MTSKILLLCLLLSVTSSALSQQMHRWVDDEGNIHFSQTPPPDQSRQESEIVTYGEKPGQGVDASCCNDVRSFAIEVGNYLRTGGSLDAVHEAFPVSTYPQITEIVNFFGRRERGSQSRFDISNRIHSACMNRALQACRVSLDQDDGSRVAGNTSGSGVIVDAHIIVTNAHVAESCNSITVGDESHRAKLVAVDRATDLAALRTEAAYPQRVNFSRQDDARLGEDVVTSGFPLAGVLGSLNITTGTVSSTTPFPDKAHLFQMTAPVQPGSSGGAVLNGDGNLIGIIVSRLSDGPIASNFGAIPQNVNFSIRSGSVKGFLRRHGLAFREGRGEQPVSIETIATKAEDFTVRVSCR